MSKTLTYEECLAWAGQFGSTPWSMLALSTASARQPGPMKVMKALFAEAERLREVLQRISDEAKVQREMAAADGYQDGYRAGWSYAGEWADEVLKETRRHAGQLDTG